MKVEDAVFHGVQQMQNLIYQGNTIYSALININKDLLKLFSADGMAYFYNDKISIFGITPNEEQIKNLIEWLNEHHNIEPFATHKLHQDYPPSINFTTHSCGLLAIPHISGKHYLLLFRNEQISEILWGGDPNNVLIRYGEDYSPRKHSVIGKNWCEVNLLSGKPLKLMQLKRLAKY